MKLARSVWHRVTRALTGAWIAVLIAAVLCQLVLPNPEWYLIHVAGLGVAGTSILVWTWHFTDALTRTKQAQDHQLVRIILLSVGTVILGVALATSGVVGAVAGLVGTLLVLAALGWHCWALRGAMKAPFAGPGAITLRYHLAGGLFFLVGALVGLVMTIDVTSFELARSWWPALYLRHDGMALMHVFSMVLGFIGLTVLGTLVTFGPSVARTRMDRRGLTWSARTLPVLVIALAVGIVASFIDAPIVAGLAAGVWALAGTVGVLLPVFSAWRESMAGVGDAWTVAAGAAWFEAGCITWAIRLVASPDMEAARSGSHGIYAVFLAAGALQLILGSLTYLLPVVAGGGPAKVRGTLEALEPTAGTRFLTLNGALVLALFPLPRGMHGAALVLAGLTGLASLVLLLWAVIRQPGRTRPETTTGAERPTGPRPLPNPRLRMGALIAACLLALSSAVGYGVGAFGGAGEPASSQGEAPVTEVDVAVEGMSFVPAKITVPAGNRLMVRLQNTGDQRHDLVFSNGAETGPVATGESATVDAGIIDESTQAWCSMVGHRQMGMELNVVVAGSEAIHDHGASESSAEMPSMADLTADPGPDFEPWDARLDPAPDATTHRVSMNVEEIEKEVAPGRTQKVWTFNGQTPGPVLRGKVGDRFIVTLTNNGSMGHSIDFHAGEVSPDEVMKTIEPGESLTYEFTANHAGIWMYHCSTSPMSLHIANGMYGAVIIDPPGLDEVDEEFVMIQGEQYWAGDPEEGTDATALAQGAPSAMTFNGYPFQYDTAPLAARAGDRVRIWVLDAGPNEPLSFHVVGTQFDTVYHEGAYSQLTEDGAAQTLGLLPAQGGFVEFTPSEPGHYSIVNHAMSQAERGAHGTLRVE